MNVVPLCSTKNIECEMEEDWRASRTLHGRALRGWWDISMQTQFSLHTSLAINLLFTWFQLKIEWRSSTPTMDWFGALNEMELALSRFYTYPTTSMSSNTANRASFWWSGKLKCNFWGSNTQLLQEIFCRCRGIVWGAVPELKAKS